MPIVFKITNIFFNLYFEKKREKLKKTDWSMFLGVMRLGPESVSKYLDNLSGLCRIITTLLYRFSLLCTVLVITITSLYDLTI